MNLLLLTYCYLPSTGGVQRSVYNLSTELAVRGHSVIIASDGPVWLHYQSTRPVRSLRLGIPTAFSSKALEHLQHGLRDAFNVAALAAICAYRRIELIHCHLINMDTRYALQLRRWLGVKVVITLRGGEFGHWVEGRANRQAYVRHLLESADAVTALSESQMQDARKAAVQLPPITAVIPNPVDPEKLAALASPRTPPARPYLVCAARLEAEKSVDLLVNAYHRLLGDHPSFPFDLVVVGSGSQEALLRDLAAEGPATGRIRFTGEVTYPEALALIRDASLLVMPTAQGEGCPNVVLEAMALGTPVLSSANPSLMELIKHGVNGETFPSGCAAALAERLLGLAYDEARRNRYVQEARTFLDHRHGMAAALSRYESLYRQLLPNRA